MKTSIVFGGQNKKEKIVVNKAYNQAAIYVFIVSQCCLVKISICYNIYLYFYFLLIFAVIIINNIEDKDDCIFFIIYFDNMLN